MEVKKPEESWTTTLEGTIGQVKAALGRQIVERQDLNTWLERQIADINELLDRLPTRMYILGAAIKVPVERVG